MRLYVRTSRRTGVSVGPVALIVLGPFMLMGWLLYLGLLALYGFGWLLVKAAGLVVDGIEAAWDRFEQRQR